MRLGAIPRRLAVALGLLVLSAVVALVGRAALDGGESPAKQSGRAADVPGFKAAPAKEHTRFSPAQAASGGLGPGESAIARARRGTVRIDASPRAGSRHRFVRGLHVGARHAPLVFLVLARRAGWVKVALPVRPNRSAGWVRARDVTLQLDPYRLEVRLRSHRLLAWRSRELILRTRIGTGRAVTPTPHGRYFIADLLKPPDPDGFYGPYAFGLSAYSPVLTSFAGGDGQIGIHGTNEPELLGSDVSHGCIRITNQTITLLARLVPVGSPVVIRD